MSRVKKKHNNILNVQAWYPNIILGPGYFMKSNFLEIIFQTLSCLFVIRKVDQRKTLFS